MTATTAGCAVDLAAATDLDRMTALIVPWLSPLARVVSAEVVDRKPGRRALLRYRLAGPGPTQDRILLGKLYTDPAQAGRVHDLMARLDQEVFAASPGLGVPRALGWSNEPPLVLYRPAPGAGIDEADGVRRSEAMAGAARWLACLHRSRLDLDRRLDVDHEVANAGAWAETIADAMPALAGEAAAAVDSLQSAAAGLRVRTDVPIHKDFHHQHLVLGPDRLAVVDLDEARLGDPAVDLAHFVANLGLAAMRGTTAVDGSNGLADVFLDAYGAETGWVPDERFDFFRRYTAVKIAKQLAVGSGLRPRPTGVERERQARLVLADAGGAS